MRTLTAFLILSIGSTLATAETFIDVRSHGATGNGTTLDTAALNAAIDAAAKNGGGTVVVPPGRYLTFSVRLRSHVTLRFEPGAIIEAADPAIHAGQYDLPEPNAANLYQDFGHSHWHNSLFYGDEVEDVSIVGPGLIDGKGLTRDGPAAPPSQKAGRFPLSMQSMSKADMAKHDSTPQSMMGLGNKAIAFRKSRNIVLRDFSIYRGGHFGVLATGVDNLTIDNVKIDTNRDGIDLDSVRNVRVSNVSVNTPNDDAIVFKSSWALGENRATENVTLTNCHVSGYDLGTLLDGTFKRTQTLAPDRDGVTGRIKLGTESNGGFRNITISNCVFDRSRGLALETVDGGVLENIAITNITMREVTTAPLFLRLGDRRRAPPGTGIGAIRGILISNVTAYDIDPRYAATIAGLPDHPIEDVTLSNIRFVYRGGGTSADAARRPENLADAYPEPSMFGVSPAFGLFVRHARNLTMRDVQLSTVASDARPAVLLEDVSEVAADHVTGVPHKPGHLKR